MRGLSEAWRAGRAMGRPPLVGEGSVHAVTDRSADRPASPGMPARVVALAARALGACSHLAAGPRLSILIFHRVLSRPDPLVPGEIDVARFYRLMTLVRTGFRVLPLEEAVRRLAHGDLPPRALAITFDDGYADNHDFAAPILQQLCLPASIFVASGFLDCGRMWNDSIVECIRRTERSGVDLGFLGLPPQSLGSTSDRRDAIDRILRAVKHFHPEERTRLVAELHRVCGRPELPDDLMLTRHQVRSLARMGMTIGAHTVNHPILQSIGMAEAEREIAEGRVELERLIGSSVTLFAYPNGRPEIDYGACHVELVRRLGFVAAVSTACGHNRAETDPFQLRRFSPWDVSDVRWVGRLAWSHARKPQSRSQATN